MLPAVNEPARFRKREAEMKTLKSSSVIQPGSPADRFLLDGLTLIALGLSVLFLNSWNTLFVRTTVGLFWGTFFLVLNWSGLVQALRSLKHANGRYRRRRRE